MANLSKLRQRVLQAKTAGDAPWSDLEAATEVIADSAGGGALPAGAATEAKQDTQIDQLSSILGSHGSVFIRGDGNPVTKTGNFIAVIGHEDFGIEDITLTGVSEGASDMIGNYPAGTQIIVPFTEIMLSDFSGLVQLVKAPSA